MSKGMGVEEGNLGVLQCVLFRSGSLYHPSVRLSCFGHECWPSSLARSHVHCSFQDYMEC
jgi:hypothetical protein